MKNSFIAPLILSRLFVGALGWGASGHQAVGYVAMEFLAPKAKAFVQTSLGSTYSSSLGPASTWADEIKSQSSYSWASVLHYVDAIDNPPSSCSVNQNRDCADGKCILTAIANYTYRVADTTLSATQRQEALKFLDHFIGDLGQPLHVENEARGGNDISVRCNGSTTNLHSLWDSGLVNAVLKTKYGNSVTTWSNALVSNIKTGSYRSQAASWLSCSSTTETVSRRHPYGIEHDLAAFHGSLNTRAAIAPLACPLVWAQDSNIFGCSNVFNYTSGTDLCQTTYATKAFPVVESQVAKQGYRLAGWLNVLFDGATLLP